MRTLGSLSLIFCFSLLFLPSLAWAANLQYVPRTSLTNPGITVKNSVGSVNITNTQFYDSSAVYTNGTIFFQVSNSLSLQLSQPINTYNFKVTSYGNGTLTLRFAGPQPPKVTTSGHLSSYSLGRQDVPYSVSDPGYGLTTNLVVSYQEPLTVFRDAAYIMALMTPIVITIGFARWTQNPEDPNRIEKMRKMYFASLAMSLMTAVLFLMSLLFK